MSAKIHVWADLGDTLFGDKITFFYPDYQIVHNRISPFFTKIALSGPFVYQLTEA